jgi:hypothetical protein
MHACGLKRIQPAEAHSLWALYAIAKSTLPLYWLHSVMEIVVAAGVASAPVAMQKNIVTNKTTRRNLATSALYAIPDNLDLAPADVRRAVPRPPRSTGVIVLRTQPFRAFVPRTNIR